MDMTGSILREKNLHGNVATTEEMQNLLTLLDPSQKKIEELHALAFFFYSKQAYQEACNSYTLLTLCSPSEPKYWKGRGASLQMLRDYEGAIDCYRSAQLLQGKEHDPYLYIHTADCHFALNKREMALAALNTTYDWALRKNDRRILKHIDLMRELWSK